MNRRLTLRRERLVELDTDRLAEVGGGQPATTTICFPREFLEKFSRTLCGPSHCSGC